MVSVPARVGLSVEYRGYPAEIHNSADSTTYSHIHSHSRKELYLT
jgi:hypothetical protein